jgi:hypothetical protein
MRRICSDRELWSLSALIASQKRWKAFSERPLSAVKKGTGNVGLGLKKIDQLRYTLYSEVEPVA